MKAPPLLAVLILSLLPPCLAQTTWNQEITFTPPTPGATPVTGIMNLSGIGAAINKKEGKCKVTKFSPGSGALEAGMQIGDAITQVDGKDVSSLDLLQIATLLRGNPDSMVVLTVQREGLDAPIIFKVIRHPVKIP